MSIDPDMQHNICTIQTRLTWINQSRSLLSSLNCFSADLPFTYIWFSQLDCCIRSGATRYNLNSWCFCLLNILNLLIANWHKWLQMSKCLKQRSLREYQKKTFQNSSWLVDGHVVWMKLCTFEASLASLDKVLATWLRYE